MSWEVIVGIAGIVVMITLAVIKWRRKDPTIIVNRGADNMWREIRKPGSIPMWVVARAYQGWYPTKSEQPWETLFMKGNYYEYKVRSRRNWVIEPHANVGNMIVYRRVKDALK